MRRVTKAVLDKQAGGEGKQDTPEDQAARYKASTEAVRAQGEYVQTVDALNNPPSAQAAREKREQELEADRKAATQKATDLEERDRARLEKEKDDATTHAQEEEQKAQALANTLQAQRDQILLNKIDELKASQKPIQEQLNEYLAFMETMATRMGFEKPAGRPASEDPHISLEIMKLELDGARQQREFEAEQAQAKRAWDLQLLEFQREGEFRTAELARNIKKDEMFASFPEVIGTAIAKGVMDTSGKGAPQRTPIGQSAAAPQPRHIEIGEGRSGSIECPECKKSVIELAPTTTVAQCLGCNTQYPVTRVPNPEPQPTEEGE